MTLPSAREHLALRRTGYPVAAPVALAVARPPGLAVGRRNISPAGVRDALRHGGDDPDAIVVTLVPAAAQAVTTKEAL